MRRVAFALRWIGRFVPPRITYEDENDLDDEGQPKVKLGPPVIGGGGSPLLTRVDLGVYWNKARDLERAIRTWDLLTFDPNFSLNITADTIKLLGDSPLPEGVKFHPEEKRFEAPCKPYTVDGNTYSTKWVSVIRFPAHHLDARVVADLERQTHSVAPVVQSEYFLMRALATIQGGVVPNVADDALYKDLWGGLYYDFKGVRTAKQAGKTNASDLDVFFEDMGIIDDADGKVKAFDKIRNKMQSDRQASMGESKVTGKPRIVLVLPTLKTTRGPSVVMITMDFRDTSIDLNQWAFANQLEPRPDAMEIIWTEPDGSQGYALFNGKGELQREVPGDIANDHGIPRPYTKRLQIMGCITCHAENNGWQPMPNEFRAPLKRGISIIADVGDKKKRADPERLNTLDNLTEGQLDELLGDLRQSLGRTVLMTTGPWPDGAKDQVDIYGVTGRSIDSLRRRFWFTPIGPEAALRELHVTMPKEKDKILARFRELTPTTGEGFEDPRMARLQEGLTLDRVRFDQFKPFLAARVATSLAREAKRKEGKP